jgi:phosphate transport system substrate-binding protein
MSFGVQTSGRRIPSQALLRWMLAAVCVGGCAPRSGPGRVEDSLTSGRILVVCSADARDLIARERDAFRALYPQADVELREGTSRQAVGALFAAQCDLAVLTRELLPEERAAATRGKLELEGYTVARDAVLAIVNPANPVENITVQELRAVYRGEVTRWSELGGPDRPIHVVIQPPASDITAFFVEAVMSGEPVAAASIYETADSTVAARVRSDRDAIGYVTLACPATGCRPLRVAALPGMRYWTPDLEAVHNGNYPLTRAVYNYVRAGGHPLANGFITYITSRDGQQIVHEAGLVPTSVPVRFVRRSPMQSSHREEKPNPTP